MKLPSYTVKIEDPDEAKARRQRERETERARRRREDLLVAYGLGLVGVLFLGAWGLVLFSSNQANQDLGRAIILLIAGGFVGYLTGRATGDK